jgi:hypothetical protein
MGLPFTMVDFVYVRVNFRTALTLRKLVLVDPTPALLQLVVQIQMPQS